MREPITSAYMSPKGAFRKCAGLNRLCYKKLSARTTFFKKSMHAIKWKEGPKELRYTGTAWPYAVPNTESRFTRFVKIFRFIELSLSSLRSLTARPAPNSREKIRPKIPFIVREFPCSIIHKLPGDNAAVLAVARGKRRPYRRRQRAADKPERLHRSEFITPRLERSAWPEHSEAKSKREPCDRFRAGLFCRLEPPLHPTKDDRHRRNEQRRNGPAAVITGRASVK